MWMALLLGWGSDMGARPARAENEMVGWEIMVGYLRRCGRSVQWTDTIGSKRREELRIGELYQKHMA